MKTIEIPSEGDILIKISLFDGDSESDFGKYVIQKYTVTKCAPFKGSFTAFCDEANETFYHEDEAKLNSNSRWSYIWYFPSRHNIEDIINTLCNPQINLLNRRCIELTDALTKYNKFLKRLEDTSGNLSKELSDMIEEIKK